MFTALFNRWAERRQVKEAKDFLSRLKSMNSDELSWPLAVCLETAEMAREERGTDVFDPFSAIAQDPAASLYFSKMAGELKKMGRVALAPGPMVWAHTLRATLNHQVRGLAREMWAELNRGAPYVEDARHELLSIYGMWPNLDRAGQTPLGMELTK